MTTLSTKNTVDCAVSILGLRRRGDGTSFHGDGAVIITVNGRGDTVSLSYEEYKNMKSRIELLEILAEAEDDVKNGRVAPISETFDDLRAMLQEG